MIKNREKLIETIKNDCSIGGHYIFEGETCAIGGLAKASGFDVNRLLTTIAPAVGINWNTLGIEFATSYGGVVKEMSDAIAEEFNLTMEEMCAIQEINDEPTFIGHTGGNSFQKVEHVLSVLWLSLLILASGTLSPLPAPLAHSLSMTERL